MFSFLSGAPASAAAEVDVLFQCTLPLIVIHSGNMGNNGAFTTTNSLPQNTYRDSYCYFPSGAISAGSAAGWYYVLWGSDTAGTVYNNTWAGSFASPPAAPASPTAFVTTGPGAFTGPTALSEYITLPFASGDIAAGDEIQIDAVYQMNNNGNNKTATWTFNTSGGGTFFTDTCTAFAFARVAHKLVCPKASQFVSFSQRFTSAATANTVNSSVSLAISGAWNLRWCVQKGFGGDSFVMDTFKITRSRRA